MLYHSTAAAPTTLGENFFPQGITRFADQTGTSHAATSSHYPPTAMVQLPSTGRHKENSPGNYIV